MSEFNQESIHNGDEQIAVALQDIEEDDWSEEESSEDEDGEEVAKAHLLSDPLDLVKDFRSFDIKCGSLGTMQHFKAQELPSSLFNWCMDLMRRNMKSLYEKSKGWKHKEKIEEMTHENSRYLIAFVNDKPVAFSHFQFDMDYGRQVLYCYEIQLEVDARGYGLGRHIMRTLEKIAEVTRLSMVVLTVFKHNPSAISFFNTIGFNVDDTNPEEDEQKDYLILSKQTKNV